MGKNGFMLVVCLAACFVVRDAWAEAHEILGIDNRDYESMFFEPDFLRVEPGDSLTFVVTRFDHKPQSIFIPEGAEHWRVENGESVTVTLRQEGVYLFDCFYHNVMGMTGVIVVGNPVNLDEARRFFERYKVETFAINKDRLDHIWDPDTGLLAAFYSNR
jgi:pseudoazurin